jgi:CheY-like chemotaxis protein
MAAIQKHVLVVDDDADTRSLLGALLTRQGLLVDYAEDGAAALTLVADHSYAVVLLDLLMPGTDGFAVLDRLAKLSVASAPVVLVITGADRSVVDQLDAHRIHGIVRKPFDPDEVAALVVACADIKSRGSFGTMALATMLAGSSLLEWLNRFAR